MRNIWLQKDSLQSNNNRYYLSIWRTVLLVIVVILLVFPKILTSQTLGTIDFSVRDQKLSHALIMLANETDLNFSYNSDEEIFQTIITYSVVKKSPLIILEDLLANTDHNYKVVGNQVVIFRNGEQSDASDKDKPVETPPQVASETVPATVITKYITRPVYDTIIITDTIVEIRVDTVTIHDTVLIEKEKPSKPQPNKIKDIPVDYFNREFSRENGWSGGVFVAPIISDFSLVRKEDKFTIRNFSLGIQISKLNKNWNFTGGLQLTHFGERFDHSYVITDGGFFVTDTIDEYYTVSQLDTTYHYVTDSTWKPVNSQEYNYAINNRIGLLELNLSVSYDFYNSRNARFYGRVGAQLGFLIYKNGFALPDENQPDGIGFDELNFATQSISGLVGIGLKYRIANNFDFNPEVYYVRYFNDIVQDYPKSTTITGVGIKIGLLYYF